MIQAIVFFAHNTRKLGKTKLCKLLYFLDFEHFKQSGRSVTGLKYNAWPMGPVPVVLYNEIEDPSPELSNAVDFKSIEIKNGQMMTVRPKSDFSSHLFSKRELKILASLAREHRDATADEMVEATHLENLPWHQVYEVQGRKQAEIPYDLAVRNDEKDSVMRIAKERDELVKSLSNEPRVGIF
ncbi:Panacea domain-containing protein [Aurantimonas endophytica]|uniref:Putative phage-associated protein n=1 Tax=Aurantimonas endophytica TaxID=1522175 RepID=A0A7W6MPP8_9HYPH|nr:Panacea domain-containing protein [Aurantimonas endophytica]MBB4003240.1 putative phage-associated protein [Aurantimonas endophytica]